ncbi:hypothetical protein Ahy_A04g020486 [Arachis hypogaea]|uniref:Serine-threonine/tyrosine-protein kinase catalytic domain-containing protein n=1 Tax=Arachis hypogaea TaxID=3818 RepID=A0A445DHS7_ARAHY|nr:hypothetical protein Ahy_A04g020486 [Arachis hypogaea]
MSSSGGLDRPALVMIIVGGIVIFISLCLAICRGRIKIVGIKNSTLVSELLLEKHKEMVERMIKVALWCVQYRPESRPMMSAVVKMLEGSEEIPQPLNPFQYLMDNGFATLPQQYSSNNCNGTTATTSSYCDSSVIDVDSNIVTADPI